MSHEDLTHQAIETLLAAIESRDLRKLKRALHPDIVWQNVPHPPSVGRDAVIKLLASIICWSDKVQWDILSSSVSGDTGWYERLDRFWIDGKEFAVSCNGVFKVDLATSTVCALKDYVDLGEWRSRVAPVMTRLANRSPADIVAHHIEAVQSMDSIAMAADYALSAVLERGGARYKGWAAIADYFDTVPGRLAGRAISFESIEALGADQARVVWHLSGADKTPLTGADTFTVAAGRIAYQLVELSGGDF